MGCLLCPFSEGIGHVCMNRQPLKEELAETVSLLWPGRGLTIRMRQFSLGGQCARAKGREKDGRRKVFEHSVDLRQRGSVWRFLW